MYKPWEILNLYFDSGEYTSFGDLYSSEVRSVDEMITSKNPSFFCINPLDKDFDHAFYMKDSYDYYIPRRADLNVCKYRNFMFEIDTLSLEEQKVIFDGCGIPWTGIVYSGGKSFHAVLSLKQPMESFNTMESIDSYKKVWNRLRAKIEFYARTIGFEGILIDVSCKNPSRLSRFPGSIRGDKVQEVIHVGSRIEEKEFNELIDSCPEILSSEVEYEDLKRPEVEICSVDTFLDICPSPLKRKLLYVDWGADAGMYPYIYKYTAWAIDSTNIAYDAFVEFLRDNTFKTLIGVYGYPVAKLRNLEECVKNVYSRKYRRS